MIDIEIDCESEERFRVLFRKLCGLLIRGDESSIEEKHRALLCGELVSGVLDSCIRFVDGVELGDERDEYGRPIDVRADKRERDAKELGYDGLMKMIAEVVEGGSPPSVDGA
jgi:hypothetical protein